MASSLELKPLSPALIPDAAATVAACPIFAPYNFTCERVTSILTRALDAEAEIVVALSLGRVVGLIWLQHKAMFGMSGYIKLVAVHPDAQGLGVGKALLGEAEARLIKDNPNVFLLTTADNHAAQAFYTYMGYQAVGTLSSYVLPGVDEIIMRKVINSPKPSTNSQQ